MAAGTNSCPDRAFTGIAPAPWSGMTIHRLVAVMAYAFLVCIVFLL